MESNFQPGDILIRKPEWVIPDCSVFECVSIESSDIINGRYLEGPRVGDVVIFYPERMLRDDFRTAVHKRRLACSK